MPPAPASAASPSSSIPLPGSGPRRWPRAALAVVAAGWRGWRGGRAAFAARVERVLGTTVLALVLAGVLWSNALGYHDVSLAPYDQLRELESIGEEFAGEGPALMTEYQPYGVRHFLRKARRRGCIGAPLPAGSAGRGRRTGKGRLGGTPTRSRCRRC